MKKGNERTEWLDRIDPEGERFKEMVVIGLKELTRDEANECLLRVHDGHQRNLGEQVAARYATDMDAGYWVPGVPVIAFDGKGRLINGQHVLAALYGRVHPAINCFRINAG
jgi:hypothetical protein